ncbi:DUF4091 domain-containing protein [Odoribacter lunatus]|uniref:DUF4091 domain-containing protein n=1 Tax=Odoribacter lunatus TaxID=2941335 RepID=UPI0020417A04|nr:glycoside hydrolase domain-containing protein [Odoribacter lunatus]
MKNATVLFFVLLFVWVGMSGGYAQETVYRQDYEELTDGREIRSEMWDNCKEGVNVSWASTDVRYDKKNVPDILKAVSVWRETAWKGERVNGMALLWTKEGCGEVKAEVSELKGPGGEVIPAESIRLGFVRYVMTDELNKDKRGTCGYRPDHTLFDSSVVADVIDWDAVLELKAQETRPLWVSIWVPQNQKAGVYRGKVSFITSAGKIEPLAIELKVLNRELPAPKDWAFRLDLWQNPFAVARYHGVPLWSKEHFEAMRPVMKLLADAGQKIITASIMHKPWGGQTEDYFESMVMRIKTLDGRWVYDYAVFDKWVEFMMSLGIDRQINCYTMIPWDLSFQYFDQSTNSLQKVKAGVGTPEYIDYWQPFLIDFARHLKMKGWFDITMIAMDERPQEAMRKAIRIIREADPGYKIALAGNYHEAIEADIDDYCVASGQFFPENVLKERREQGKISTYYTCCSEAYPNTFTFSPPAESAWLGWYAAAKDFDGYLRWAYNSWTADPLKDSRFRAFGGGDCYLAYPAGRSSIRMERLIEGIQAYEKVRILKAKYAKEKNAYKLKLMEDILDGFEIEKLVTEPAADMVNKARTALNKL